MNRKKNGYFYVHKEQNMTCTFKPFQPLLWILSHCPPECPRSRWGLHTAAGAPQPGKYHVRRCICHHSSCKEDRACLGQRLACDSLLINKHLCFPFALCNLMVKVSKKCWADIKKTDSPRQIKGDLFSYSGFSKAPSLCPFCTQWFSPFRNAFI